MKMIIRIAALALAAAVVVIAAACGGGDAEPRSFEVTLERGRVVSGETAFVVQRGAQVTLDVASDMAGVFHVHGYDLRARVEAGGAGRIAFEADATGRFTIAMHPSGPMEGMEHGDDLTVATLEVRP